MQAENERASGAGKRAAADAADALAAKRRRSDGPGGAFDELVSCRGADYVQGQYAVNQLVQ